MESRSCPVAALRVHAKVLLFSLTDGRRLTWEGSANLQRVSNVETGILTNDPELFTFHSSWVKRLFDQHAAKTKWS